MTGTLQAAIADPEVAARLGTTRQGRTVVGLRRIRFDDSRRRPAQECTRSREPEPEPPAAAGPTKAEVNAARRRRAVAEAEAEAAQQAHSAAVEDLDTRRTKLNTARRRYEKLLESLTAAERELNGADADHGSAERAVEDAADRVRTAKSALAEANSELAAVTARLSR